MFLPPYSPELNPIEMVVSMFKQHLHSMACQMGESLWRGMLSVLDATIPSDAVNCLRHCGYTLRQD